MLAYINQDDAGLGRLNNIERLRATAESRRIFFDASDALYPLGAIVPNPDLASTTLERIAQNGADELHRGGETGQRVADDMERNGGLITLDDLAASEILELEPLWIDYRGFRWRAAPCRARD